MRIIAFILSLVVLSISLAPCTDGIAGHSHEEISIDSDHHQNHSCNHDHDIKNSGHDHSDGSEDDCPPFCNCTCCGISITVPSYDIWTVSNISHQFSYSFHYSINYTYNFSEGLWHPPSFM